jgi:SnoaL-like domain
MRAFREAVEAKDIGRATELLADDVTFRSPAVFKPYEGKETVTVILQTVVEVFEDFRYVDELEGEDTSGLVFRARVGDRELEGWDYIRPDANGLIAELVVMVRPLSGLNALAQAMGERLGAAS